MAHVSDIFTDDILHFRKWSWFYVVAHWLKKNKNRHNKKTTDFQNQRRQKVGPIIKIFIEWLCKNMPTDNNANLMADIEILFWYSFSAKKLGERSYIEPMSSSSQSNIVKENFYMLFQITMAHIKKQIQETNNCICLVKIIISFFIS